MWITLDGGIRPKFGRQSTTAEIAHVMLKALLRPTAPQFLRYCDHAPDAPHVQNCSVMATAQRVRCSTAFDAFQAGPNHPPLRQTRLCCERWPSKVDIRTERFRFAEAFGVPSLARLGVYITASQVE